MKLKTQDRPLGTRTLDTLIKSQVLYHPIIFSTESVPKLLDGTKTQTRRVIKPQPLGYLDTVIIRGREALFSSRQINATSIRKCPYGQVGDRLWVRETWKQVTIQPPFCKEITQLRYKADCLDTPDTTYWVKWRPSIHMFRWASRIELEITKIRVERVQNISPNDVLPEGVLPYSLERGDWTFTDHISAFAKVWNSLNAKRGYGWDKNPWVWCLNFKRIKDE